MTNNALAVLDNSDKALIVFDGNKIDLIKRTVAKGATDDELALFLHQAQRMGLDPLSRQIHFQKYNTKDGPKIAIITGIDGYRLIADRTGCYAGSDEPEFDGRISFAGKDAPAKATVKVWKIVQGKRVPFAASVYWNEYVPDKGRDFQWQKMPHVMLAKCAEAAALRKAFPADLSGAYIQEEMQQADWYDIEPVTVTNGKSNHEHPGVDYIEAEIETVTDSQPAKSQPTPTNGNGKKPEPVAASDIKPPMPTEATKAKFHKLGTDFYGDSWDDERPRLVTWITKKRQPAPAEPITSSNDLYRAEMQSLIDGLEDKLEEKKGSVQGETEDIEYPTGPGEDNTA